MKKAFKFLAIFAAMAVMAFSAAACSNSSEGSQPSAGSSVSAQQSQADESKDEQSSQDEESTEESSEEESSEEESSDEEKMTFAELFSEPQFRDKLNELQEQLTSSNPALTCEITIEGDSTLLITMRFNEQQTIIPSDLTTLEKATDVAGTQFVSFIEGAEELTTTEDITVKVVYLNADGSSVYEKTYDKYFVPAEESSEPEESSNPIQTSGLTPAGEFASLDDYINDPRVQAQMESAMETVKSNGLDMTYYSEDGTKFVYDYRYTIDITEAQKSAVVKSMDSLSTTMAYVAKSIEDETGLTGISVITRYRDKDGNLIGEKEFFPDDE